MRLHSLLNHLPLIVLCLLLFQRNMRLLADESADGSDSPLRQDALSLFQRHCVSCHGVEHQEAGLRLDRRHSAIQGGDNGPVLKPRDVAGSEVMRRIRSADPTERMPPEESLSEAQIAVIAEWIEQGCEWPDSNDTPPERRHWAYQPIPISAAIPVEDAWIRNDIDRFVLQALRDRGLSPSEEASRETLIRRASLDLTGLLPEPAEVDAFLNDSSPEAWERVVDRLLASPPFGERWGRHWLDLARYADSDGYEKDNARPDAWRWRDWVIEAINSDMPFDQFTIEQMAGDLLPGATPTQHLATAFHRQTLTNTEGGTDQEQFRVDACFDRTETTATVWMGMTLGCARCHSHKYEAISQREYYQLFSLFNNSDESTTVMPASDAELREWELALAQFEQQRDALAGQPDSAGKLKELEKQKPKKPGLTVRVLNRCSTDFRPSYVLRRGDFLQPLTHAEVTPAAPEVLPPLKSRNENAKPDRLDFAQWLMSPDHPLTARVTVNQVWAKLFGQGLVRTPSDFGTRGERPSHPELLDWLAGQFQGRHAIQQVTPAWSRKSLIRLIMMSATYRQSSAHRDELKEQDPLNQWLGRQNRLRVEGEIVRDVSLQAAGLLDRTIGGPSVFPPLPEGIAELSYAGNFKWQESTGGDRYRRGLYTFFKRTSPHPNLITFDCPDANLTCVQRMVSNTPLQALQTLNNETFLECARGLALRVLTGPDSTESERIVTAFRMCYGRQPDPDEHLALASLHSDAADSYRQNPEEAGHAAGAMHVPDIAPEIAAAWVVTSRVLLNTDEFLTRE